MSVILQFPPCPHLLRILCLKRQMFCFLSPSLIELHCIASVLADVRPIPVITDSPVAAEHPICHQLLPFPQHQPAATVKEKIFLSCRFFRQVQSRLNHIQQGLSFLNPLGNLPSRIRHGSHRQPSSCGNHFCHFRCRLVPVHISVLVFRQIKKHIISCYRNDLCRSSLFCHNPS